MLSLFQRKKLSKAKISAQIFNSKLLYALLKQHDACSNKKTLEPSNEKRNEKVKESSKEEGFFSSAMSLIKSKQNKGIILVKGSDPPNPISLFCDSPFPSFMISTMEVLLVNNIGN